ncbi:MAG: M23 family metallopeptidase [Brevefilum sp.]|nr:M23 family metallopeptidase [Brevefilum sp.]
MRKYLPLVLAFLLCACQPQGLVSTATPAQPLPTATTTPSPPPLPTVTLTPLPTRSSTPYPTFEVCSPLEDETLQSLPLILTNPLVIPPSFGQDTGHHGVDFAYYQRGDRMSIEGIEIYAIMAGKTVLTLDDDIPYGYAVIIETPLSDLPEAVQQVLLTGYLPVPKDPNYRLSCPEVPVPALTGELSVYHLYAHMEARSALNRGDPIACGDKLGTVGNTGYSSNPHLHLETRLGPSGADFKTMAHYESTNTTEQIGNYCLWRMSGYYQLFDPFILFDSVD